MLFFFKSFSNWVMLFKNYCRLESFFFCFVPQSSTSALSDMIDPSERKVLEFPTVGEKNHLLLIWM